MCRPTQNPHVKLHRVVGSICSRRTRPARGEGAIRGEFDYKETGSRYYRRLGFRRPRPRILFDGAQEPAKIVIAAAGPLEKSVAIIPERVDRITSHQGT